MKNISVESAKCSGCGLCVKACPHKLLVLDSDVATTVAGDCMNCGHCQAVCPTGAIEVAGLSLALDFTTFAERLETIAFGDIDCSSLVQLMRSRRSCRSYREKPVPLAMLEDLVKIGTTAPSGTNSQSWNFVILPRRADVQVLAELTADFYQKLNIQAKNRWYRYLAYIFAGDKLGNYYRNYYESVNEALKEWKEDGVDRLFHGSVAAILVTGRRDASCPAEDALLATQNILLAAHGLGLGSCLIGFVVEAMKRDGNIRRLMAIPAQEDIYSVIALGYPALHYQRVAGRQAVQPRILHLAS